MGWRITLKADRPIMDEDVQKIVDELPEDLTAPFFGPFPYRTSWGWLAATDIYYPEGNELELGGSYSISGAKARPMAERLTSELEKLGYTIISDINGDLAL